MNIIPFVIGLIFLIVVNVINFKLWRRFKDNTLYVLWSMSIVAADLGLVWVLWIRLTRF